MNIPTTLVSTNFDKAVAKMRKLTGKSLKDVIKFEAAVVFPKAITKTGRADIKRINRRYTVKATQAEAKRGEVPKQDPLLLPWVRIGGVKEKTRAAICNPKKLPLVKRELAAQKKIARARVNLSKATFAIWADLHGVSMQVSSTVKKAMDNSGRYRSANSVSARGIGDSYTVTFKSRGEALIFGAGGRSALFNAMKKPRWSAKSIDEAISKIRKACAGTGITVKGG